MTCPKCGAATKVVKTEHRKGAKWRFRRCRQLCGAFWTKSVETVVNWLQATVDKGLPATENERLQVDEKPLPATVARNPLAKSDPDLSRSPSLMRSDSVRPQRVDHVEEKTNPHRGMLLEFVGQWDSQYGDKYPVDPKDVAQLAGLIKRHPDLVERWPEMVSRYLDDPFWGEQRHPLFQLCTHSVSFAGDKVVAGNSKVARNLDVARNWKAPGHRSAG